MDRYQVFRNIVRWWKLGFDIKFFASFSLVISLISTIFRMLSIVFPKTELFISLKKSFSKVLVASALSHVLKSIYSLSHGLSVKVIPL